MKKQNIGKTIFAIIATMLFQPVLSNTVYAGTTVIAGKDASSDGSHYVGRTADFSSMFSTSVEFVPGRNDKEEALYSKNGLEISLPKKAYSCIIQPVIGKADDTESYWECGVNEKNVGISATETILTREEVLKADSFVENGLSEANIPVLILPYIDSAKDGAERFVELVSEYGISSSEAVVFIDSEEIWYAESYCGHYAAAQKVPDDACGIVENSPMLTFYDEKDGENWIATKGIVDFAKDNGLYTKEDGKFSLALSFGAKSEDLGQGFVKAEKKAGLKEAFEFCRDNLSGTTQSHFIQMGDDLKKPIMWACNSDSEFGLYVPVLADVTEIPESLSSDSTVFEAGNISWELRNIANIASLNKDDYSDIVRKAFSTLENKYISSIGNMEEADSNEVLAQAVELAEDVISDVKSDLITRISEDAATNSGIFGRGYEYNLGEALKEIEAETEAKNEETEAISEEEAESIEAVETPSADSDETVAEKAETEAETELTDGVETESKNDKPEDITDVENTEKKSDSAATESENATKAENKNLEENDSHAEEDSENKDAEGDDSEIDESTDQLDDFDEEINLDDYTEAELKEIIRKQRFIKKELKSIVLDVLDRLTKLINAI